MLPPPLPAALTKASTGQDGRDALGLAAALGGMLRGGGLVRAGQPVTGYPWAGSLAPASLDALAEALVAEAQPSGGYGVRPQPPSLDLAAVAAWGQTLPDPAQRAAVLGQLGLTSGLPPLPAIALAGSSAGISRCPLRG